MTSRGWSTVARATLSVALLLSFIALMWVYSRYRESRYREVLPPEGTETLASLAKAAPPTDQLSVIEDQGKQYFVWIGRTDGIPGTSGPPVHVFDDTGKLIDRNKDIGDASSGTSRRYFALGREGRAITYRDAIALTTKRGRGD
jgi:hypothetical protein